MKKSEMESQHKNERTLKEIGIKVRSLRKAITSNYEIFAKENQINKVTLARIENGENCTMSSLIDVINALKINLDDFFAGIK